MRKWALPSPGRGRGRSAPGIGSRGRAPRSSPVLASTRTLSRKGSPCSGPCGRPSAARSARSFSRCAQ
eukprot:scaffold3202_cov117-Isochrysis_galbana.AAC.2